MRKLFLFSTNKLITQVQSQLRLIKCIVIRCVFPATVCERLITFLVFYAWREFSTHTGLECHIFYHFLLLSISFTIQFQLGFSTMYIEHNFFSLLLVLKLNKLCSFIQFNQFDIESNFIAIKIYGYPTKHYYSETMISYFHFTNSDLQVHVTCLIFLGLCEKLISYCKHLAIRYLRLVDVRQCIYCSCIIFVVSINFQFSF